MTRASTPSARVRFAPLVAAHSQDVLRLCRAVLRDEHLAQDASQEAFVRLWRRLESPAAEPLGETGAWLRKAALSAALDLSRKRAARPHDAPGEPALEAPDSAAGPDADAALGELRARLERAVESLPEGQRTVFRLRHAGGYGLAEVAALLELSPSTVKTHFARAAVRVQHELSAFAEPNGDT